MANATNNRGAGEKADLPEKMCVICGVDVAQLPRVKDETGRYMCRPCAVKQVQLSEKMAGQAQDVVDRNAGRGAGGRGGRVAADDPDAGIDLAGAASVERAAAATELPAELACPKCGGYMENDQKLCLRCGFDRERKVTVTTKVEKAREVKEERRRYPGMGVEGYLALLGMGLGLLSVLGAVQGFVMPELVVPGAAVLMLSAVAATITIGFLQFRDGEVVWGILTALSPFVPFTSFGVLYWTFAINDRNWIKYWYGLNFLASILLVVAIFSGKADGVRDVFDRKRSNAQAPSSLVHTTFAQA